MDKTRIFISYRRDESTLHAGWIHDRLAREFGHENVFLDHTIQPGDDFVQVLTEKVRSCDVLLAVIGKSWMEMKDAAGRLRIQNPDDFVAIEIGEALRRDVRVIPVLVGGGRMPISSELPQGLTALARRQAHELPDKGFIGALENLFPVLRKSMTAMAGATTVRSVELEAGEKRVHPEDGLTYIWIPPGSFMMGCSPGDDEGDDLEKPAHRVEITKGFWVGETPVTHGGV